MTSEPRQLPLLVLTIALVASAARADDPAGGGLAGRLIGASGFSGGLVTHIGCGDGRLTTELSCGGKFLVHGLALDGTSAVRARQHIAAQHMEGKVSAEQTSPEPMCVGTTHCGVNRAMGMKMPWTSKITEYEPDRKCCEVITSGSTRIDERLTFEPTDIGTKFTQVYDMKIGGFLKLMSPMVVSSMRKQVKANLNNLKNILEGNS